MKETGNTWSIGRHTGIQHSAFPDKGDRRVEEPHLGIVKSEKFDIVKTVNRSGTHLGCSLSIVFLQ